eukprot:TRINITY_DN17087_c0_g1_i1.p1 TRINITY_DN17087_c0_g1~~TRINITY_DN17087_c0_g1_i1.p1  ORF type:complete len:1058 (+),score=104.25 TRINITY_DN17087_c0_g1_i1:456-3176(+)
MHAAVAAQSYQARVLTQLVRLPIPTWAEVESCRTFGSNFEQIDPKQMFRIPFVTRRQEAIASRYAAATPAEQTNVDTAVVDFGDRVGPCSNDKGVTSDLRERTDVARMATDPWGLERRGDDIYELGQHSAEEVAQLRHIKIIRQAAVYWQTYDAFARVSMSVGVNQLMLAISYYTLGYALWQVQCPVPAFAGVIIFTATSEIVARIDLSLTLGQQRLIQALLVAGPAISSAAAYNSILGYDQADAISLSLAPLAFLSHGAVLALMTLFLGVSEQENGAMLPLAFQGVLFLDVFGWVTSRNAFGNVKPTAAEPSCDSVSATRCQARSNGSDNCNRVLADLDSIVDRKSGLPESDGKTQSGLGYYAADYLPGPQEIVVLSEADSEEAHDAPEAAVSSRRPVMACVEYCPEGKPCPKRPDDFLPEGAAQDMRLLPGAPRITDKVCAITPPAKEFFEPVSFMPPESRSRHKMDELFEDHQVHVPLKNSRNGETFAHISTGHDHESPGLLPWRIFHGSAFLLCFVWFLAAAISVLDILEGHAFSSKGHEVDEPLESVQFATPPSLLKLWAAGFAGISLGPTPERVAVTWPYHPISPRGLSCDSTGLRLLVTDGISTYTATLESSEDPSGHSRTRRQVSLDSTSTSSGMRADFQDVMHCDALRGEAILDTALFCPRAHNASSIERSCTAAVLYRRGKRLAYCTLPVGARDAVSDPETSYAISQSWLNADGATQSGVLRDPAESVEWVLGDSDCVLSLPQLRDGSGCISVGTSHGRVARLRQERMSFLEAKQENRMERMMAPEDIVVESQEDWNQEEGRPISVAGVVRAFNSRFIGVLQPKRKSIYLLDLSSSVSSAGTLMLPPIAAPDSGNIISFCSGGGHLYMLGSGPNPGIWRMNLPSSLQSDGVSGGVK